MRGSEQHGAHPRRDLQLVWAIRGDRRVERYVLPKPSEDPKKTPQAGGATLEEVIEEEEEDVAEMEEKDGAEEERKDEEEHGEIGLGLSLCQIRGGFGLNISKNDQ